jgi:hypothetical protein
MKAGLKLCRQHKGVMHAEFSAWCMLVYSDINPVEFRVWILDSFPETFVIDRGCTCQRLDKNSRLQACTRSSWKIRLISKCCCFRGNLGRFWRDRQSASY